MDNEITVVVGNIGTVETTENTEDAILLYNLYVQSSQLNIGRCGGENVALLIGDEIIREHIGLGESK